MWITIRVPPGSKRPLELRVLFEQLGFTFDFDRIALVHADGSIIEYAPGPAPNAS